MFLSIVLMVGAYLAGSINFSILLFYVVGKEDPRQTFSGNPGATNVYRQAGMGWAAAVLLLDMGRAMGVAYLGVSLAPPDWVPWMGLALIVGNRYPCFHGFRGGKGVANYLGFTVVVAPVAALLSIAAWGAVFLLFKTPFLSSFAMVAVLTVGVGGAYHQSAAALAGAVVTAGVVVWNHRQNMMDRWGGAKKIG